MSTANLPAPPQRISSPTSPAAAMLFALVGVSWSIWLLGMAGVLDGAPDDADSTADWLVTRAAFDGTGAYRDPVELAGHYRVDYRYHLSADTARDSVSHPRTPGALLLQAPLLLLSVEAAFGLAAAGNLAIVGLILMVTFRRQGWPPLLLMLAIPAAVLSFPVLVNLRFGAQSLLVAGLVTAAWWLTSDGDSRVAGIALGIAGVLKAFPLLLVVPLAVARRWHAVSACAATVALLTIGGLLLPGVGWADSVEALTGASSIWLLLDSNGSVAGALGRWGVPTQAAVLVGAMAALGVGVFIWHRLFRSPDSLSIVLAITVVIGLLASPISWISYDAALLPVAFGMLTLAHNHRPARLAATIWVVIMLGTPWLPLHPDTILMSRLVLFAGLTALLHSQGSMNLTRRAERSARAADSSGGPRVRHRTPV